MKLFVGDNLDPTLPKEAKQYNANACLLTKDNIGSVVSDGVFYTSLADLGEDLFFDVCKKADTIFYHPPLTWSDSNDQKKLVEIILCYVSQFISVVNFDQITLLHSKLQQSFLKGFRKTFDTQIWTVGCSITAGFALDVGQSWPDIIAKEFNLPLTNLAEIGSSIIWQSDQICRADICSGDLVFWGMPSHNRVPMLDPKSYEIEQLNPGRFSLDSTLNKKFPIEILDSPSLVYHNILAIRRAVNYCQKVNAKITILGLMHDFDCVYKSYRVKEFKQYWSWPMANIDNAKDNQHPGPEQHKIFAKEFQKFYLELYNK